MITSGAYERFFTDEQGNVYHHILDPKTGISADSDLASATIVSESSMTADALATACIVMGRNAALDYLTGLGMNGILITREGEITLTPGFEDIFPFTVLRTY